MQQYFCENPVKVNEDYVLNAQQSHHASVVRLDHEIVRLVHHGIGYFGECCKEQKQYIVHVTQQDERINETGIEITIAQALIRREKFEFVLQKATELGVTKIVPFESSRCVVHSKKEKAEKQLQRWNDIVLEASEQCKRNRIPEVTDVLSFRDLKSVCSEVNVAPYENAYGKSSFLSDHIDGKKSVTIVIGPEGGFSEQEVDQLREMGYEPVTLGSRILRAETASIYALSVCSEIAERMHHEILDL